MLYFHRRKRGIHFSSGSGKEMTETTSFLKILPGKRGTDHTVFTFPTVQSSGEPPPLSCHPLKRLYKRWKECWRLAALPAPESKPVPTGAVSAGPLSSPGAQDGEYVPKAGMRGKHVEWVPCSPVVIDKMLHMAGVGADDYLIDPGSGDGRIAIKAAKLGARAHGIEFNPKLVTISRDKAAKEGVGDRATFSVGDFFEADLSKATVVTLFLRKDLNLKLRARILGLTPGTRIVSNIFDMGDWEADKIVQVEDETYYFRNHTVRLWIVPAKIEGLWKLPHGELTIFQKFQRIEGNLTMGGKSVPIEGCITGNHFVFTADSRQYTGRVTGGRMDIEVTNGSGQPSALSLQLKRSEAQS
jgi:hypothetical protein